MRHFLGEKTHPFVRCRAAFALGFACLFFLCGCNGIRKLSGYDEWGRFGTQIRWAYVASELSDPGQVWQTLSSLAERIEAEITTESKESSVARFNAADAGERVPIGKEAYEMLSAAKKIYEETKGTYNPATGLLVDLWGFSPRHRAADYAPQEAYDRSDFMTELPDERYIEKFSSRGLLDFSAVELGWNEEGGYYAVKPQDASVSVTNAQGEEETYSMQLNLGGVGKGYCADRAAEMLRPAGQTYGYYSLGGSSLALFSDPAATGGVWSITVNSPRDFSGSYYATLHLRDTMISTSGDYEQYYEIGGRRYCHIIDPRSGYPVGGGSHVVCATVVGGTATEGDARATALCCMDLCEALAYCREYADEFEAIFIWYDETADEYTIYSNVGGWSPAVGLRAVTI